MREVVQEQAHVDEAYARLDQIRERTAHQLAEVRRAGAVGTPQARSERDAFTAMYENRAAQLRGVEDRLCFGRLDLTEGTRRYIGRIGLSDDERRQLLVDWRAPSAQSFYRATAAQPDGVVRRRHIVTRGRTVTGVEDEVLDLDSLAPEDAATLTGEGALLAALNASRSGHMRDIVGTIQAEQDTIIRSDLAGVLVVQGGPGTGKTAVALHRAAYLLYTHRGRLERSGVLLLGPNATFLRYIERVLPSLGETGVVMSTIGSLLPDVEATAVDDDAAAAVKGDPRMVDVLAAAVRSRQRVPRGPIELTVDGHRVVIRPGVVAAAREHARRRARPHNTARSAFLLELLDDLVRQLARDINAELDQDTRTALRSELRDSADVRRELNLLWLPLSPARLLADLYADGARLAEAAPRLTREERRALRRDRGAAWTAADVPLLDELAELLGEDDSTVSLAGQLAAADRRHAVEYAEDALALRGGDGLVTAAMLADRFSDSGPVMSVAERAAGDRTWTYGHVVIDEAQELSAMAWRMVMRRCPSRSMTVVGDLAQTSSPAGAGSWDGVLDPYVAGRWRLENLTVNYRTPRQVMDIAAAVLAAGGGAEAVAPRSARDGIDVPRAVGAAGPAALAGTVVATVGAELAGLGDGRLAVLTSRASFAAVAAAVGAAYPGRVSTATSLDDAVTVLTVREAKGLEVDVVVVVEPAEVLAESPRGVADLYVALTRPTQRLRVVHARPLPAAMMGMRTVDGV